MWLREGGVGGRSELELGISSAVAGCVHLNAFGSVASPRFGRPSTPGVWENGLVADGHPSSEGFGNAVFVIWEGGGCCSNTLVRTLGGFVTGDTASKLLRFERLSSLWERERGMSKLTLRPEVGDVGKAKIFGDRPFWVIVSGRNRVLSADKCKGLPRHPSAKPRPRDPVFIAQGRPPLRGEDLNRGL